MSNKKRGETDMYEAIQIQIKQTHPLYEYCSDVTRFYNNMYNASLFRIRQVMTAVKKDKLTDNEIQVMQEVQQTVDASGGKYKMPTAKKWMLSYTFLDLLFKITDNPDYYCKGLQRQSAQNAIKDACNDFKSYFKALKSYKANPKAFTGMPKLPHYKKSGGHATISFTNQGCICRDDINDSHYSSVRFPFTKQCIRIPHKDSRLKSVTIKPYHDIYIISFTFENSVSEQSEYKPAKRIAAIDFGVSNIAAITNNIGMPCLLFKGGIVKSVNQYYNKRTAEIMSAQTKGTTNKFIPTPEYRHITIHRNNFMSDYMHKLAKYIVNWCIENDIDTLVLGENKQWKQNSDMDATNNQNFVQIPYDKLKFMLSYLCERHSIRCIRQEESYTSKASFLDNDFIYTYGVDDKDVSFSGHRIRRGLYKTGDGTIINADLNGSANIGRKAFPEAFCNGIMPDFNNVIIIRNPDIEAIEHNRQMQLQKYTGISNAKRKRLTSKCNPYRIGLCG